MTHGPISKGVPGSHKHEIQYWRQDSLPFALFDLVLSSIYSPFCFWWYYKDTVPASDCQGISSKVERWQAVLIQSLAPTRSNFRTTTRHESCGGGVAWILLSCHNPARILRGGGRRRERAFVLGDSPFCFFFLILKARKFSEQIFKKFRSLMIL